MGNPINQALSATGVAPQATPFSGIQGMDPEQLKSQFGGFGIGSGLSSMGSMLPMMLIGSVAQLLFFGYIANQAKSALGLLKGAPEKAASKISKVINPKTGKGFALTDKGLVSTEGTEGAAKTAAKTGLSRFLTPAVTNLLKIAGVVGGGLLAYDGMTDVINNKEDSHAIGGILKTAGGGGLAAFSLGAAVLPAAIAAGGVAMVADGYKQGSKTEATIGGAAAFGGATALGFAIAGATLGSTVPVVGTIVGAVVGGVVGYFIGKAGADKKESQQTQELAGLQKQFKQQVAQSGIEGKITQLKGLQGSSGSQEAGAQAASVSFSDAVEKEAKKIQDPGEKVDFYKKALAGLPQAAQQIDMAITQKTTESGLAQMTASLPGQLSQLFKGSLGSNPLFPSFSGGMGLGSNPLSQSFSGALGSLSGGLGTFGLGSFPRFGKTSLPGLPDFTPHLGNAV